MAAFHPFLPSAIGEAVRMGRVDLLRRLGAAIGYNLLNRFQASFYALHLGSILYG
jgi:hypothetical protein